MRNTISGRIGPSQTARPKAVVAPSKRSESAPSSESQDKVVLSGNTEAKASVWDTKSGVEKAGSSVIGGWLGLGTVGTLLALATPIGVPVALAVGFAAGVGATQAKGRLLKSDLTKAEAAQQKETKAKKPVIWNESSTVEKLRRLGVMGAVGAVVVGAIGVAASLMAAPVALAVGAMAGLAGGFGYMNVARNSDSVDLGSQTSPRDDQSVRLTSNGKLQYGLGGGIYLSSDGEHSIDYNGRPFGPLTSLSGKSQGQFLS